MSVFIVRFRAWQWWWLFLLFSVGCEVQVYLKELEVQIQVDFFLALLLALLWWQFWVIDGCGGVICWWIQQWVGSNGFFFFWVFIWFLMRWFWCLWWWVVRWWTVVTGEVGCRAMDFFNVILIFVYIILMYRIEK